MSFLLPFILAIPILLISYLFFKLLISPYLLISSYRKQGVPGYFYPLLGTIKRGKDSERLYKDSMGYYKNLARTDPNVRAEVANFGSRVCLILYDPNLIKEFYNTQSRYKKVTATNVLKTLLGSGLLLAEGQVWKNHRRVISNVFHFEFLKENISLIVSTTREYLQELKSTSMKEVKVMDEIQKITGEIVGRIFFGESLNNYKINDEPLTLYLAHLNGKFGTVARNPKVFFLTSLGLNPEWVAIYRKHMQDIRGFRNMCFKIVQDRKNSGTGKANDMLGLLLETQKSGNPEDVFTDEDIINEFVTFFFAGMDTTGHLITMMLYLIAKNPEYLEKIEQEVEQYYNQKNIADMESLNKMDILHGVLKEALRLYTPAPTIFPRLAAEDHNLLDIKVKKGMSVRPTALYNGSNEKYFEEPEKFKPERWLNKKGLSIPFVDIPFSAGARNCIGQHLAIIESKVIVSEFVKMFKFKVVPEDYGLVMSFGFLYEPKKQILMDLSAK